MTRFGDFTIHAHVGAVPEPVRGALSGQRPAVHVGLLGSLHGPRVDAHRDQAEDGSPVRVQGTQPDVQLDDSLAGQQHPG